MSDDLRDLRAEARTRDFNWVPGGVSGADRAARNGHRSALIMFVGKAGTGKHTHARALEKALFEAGRNVYMLDGQNVLLGVDHDLWVDAAQSELVRRFGEVAHLLLNAGLIVVSTTNAIGLGDATAVQALAPDAPMLLIDVDPSGSSTQGLRSAHPRHRVRGRGDRRDRRAPAPPADHEAVAGPIARTTLGRPSTAPLASARNGPK